MPNLSPGIHQNVKLAKVEYASKGTWEAIDFLFAKDDEFFRHRVFSPKEEHKERTRDHINFILSFFADRDEIKAVKGKNFEDFVHKLAKMLKEKRFYEKTLHIKTYQGKSGYAEIPSFITKGFIQPGDVTCSLAYTDWEIEKNMAPTISAPEAAAKDEDDDLPF